jgi:predicted phage terminase large subunit-like protein
LLPETKRKQVLAGLTEEKAQELLHTWEFWARPNQLPPPGDWRTWLILAGRGFGKTRTGAEWVRAQIENGKCKRIALIAPTAADAREVMVEGESGLMNICPPNNRPLYEPSKRRLTWPNGAIATTYSADEPERLRGPQHDAGWLDELASWRRPETFDMFLFGLRLGPDPRAVVTTTPKPIKILKELLKDKTTHVTKGSTYDNRANLAPTFFEKVVGKYEGTRLGRQELLAELLEDTPGALWNTVMLEKTRVTQYPELSRVVIGVDPSISNNEGSAETGIIGVGLGDFDRVPYVLEDASLQGSPHEWATAVIATFNKFKADRIVVEVNNGGDMCESVIRMTKGGENLPITKVHASRGKYTRAEPIAALYEQGRAHHVGYFPELESQMTTYVPGETSPDRMDALVWACTALIGTGEYGAVSNEITGWLSNLDGSGW